MSYSNHENNAIKRRIDFEQSFNNALQVHRMKKLRREIMKKSNSKDREKKDRLLKEINEKKQLLLSIAFHLKSETFKLTTAEHLFLTGKEVIKGYMYILLLIQMKLENKINTSEYESLLRLAIKHHIISDYDFKSLHYYSGIKKEKEKRLAYFLENKSPDDFNLPISDEKTERENASTDMSSFISRAQEQEVIHRDWYFSIEEAEKEALKSVTEEDDLFSEKTQTKFDRFSQKYFSENVGSLNIAQFFPEETIILNPCSLVLVSDDFFSYENIINKRHLIEGLAYKFKTNQGFIFDGMNFYYANKDREIMEKLEIKEENKEELKTLFNWSKQTRKTYRKDLLSENEIKKIISSMKPRPLWNQYRLKMIEDNIDRFDFYDHEENELTNPNSTKLEPKDILALPSLGDDDQKMIAVFLKGEIDFKAPHFKNMGRSYFVAAAYLKKIGSSIEEFEHDFGSDPYKAIRIELIAIFSRYENKNKNINLDLMKKILASIIDILDKNKKTELNKFQIKLIEYFIVKGYPYLYQENIRHGKFNFSCQEDIDAFQRFIIAIIDSDSTFSENKKVDDDFIFSIFSYAHDRKYFNSQKKQDETALKTKTTESASTSNIMCSIDDFSNVLKELSNYPSNFHRRLIRKKAKDISYDEIEKFNMLSRTQLCALLSPQSDAMIDSTLTWDEKIKEIKKIITPELTKNDVIFILDAMKNANQSLDEAKQSLKKLRDDLSGQSIAFDSIKEKDIYAILHLIKNEKITFYEAYHKLTEELSLWQASYVRDFPKRETAYQYDYIPLNWITAFSDKDHFDFFIHMYSDFSYEDKQNNLEQTRQLFDALASLLTINLGASHTNIDTQSKDTKYDDHNNYTFIDYLQINFSVELNNVVSERNYFAVELFNKIMAYKKETLFKPEWQSFIPFFNEKLHLYFNKQKEDLLEEEKNMAEEASRKEKESEEMQKRIIAIGGIKNPDWMRLLFTPADPNSNNPQNPHSSMSMTMTKNNE